MPRSIGRASLALGALGLLATAVWAEKPDPAAVIEKTEFNAAKPAKARKLLLYSHPNGFPHTGAIEAAKVAFPALGKKTGAFECVVSDDLANFEADKLQEFDAVFFSNTTGDLFTGKAFEKCANRPAKEDEAKTTERLRKNLVEFVKSGKGLMGNHSACDCSYGWREWGEMLGGYFIGHPWGTIWVTNDDPDSPINAVFKGEGFQISDEIYTFGTSGALKWDAYGRDKNRVLLSVNMEKSKIDKGPRADGDHGLSWIKTYGNGRTFYCAFGHDERAFVNPTILQHLLAGTQYVLGDLKADATPKPKTAK